MNDRLNREEREILEKFDRGELRPVTGLEGEIDDSHVRRLAAPSKRPVASTSGLRNATSISPTPGRAKRGCRTRRYWRA